MCQSTKLFHRSSLYKHYFDNKGVKTVGLIFFNDSITRGSNQVAKDMAKHGLSHLQSGSQELVYDTHKAFNLMFINTSAEIDFELTKQMFAALKITDVRILKNKTKAEVIEEFDAV